MDERTRKFYEEYILTNENYVEKELYPLENIKSLYKKILLSSKYGKVSIVPDKIKNRNNFSIQSAVSKTDYFKRFIEKTQPEIFEALTFKSEYVHSSKKMVFGTKYGDVSVIPNNLFKGGIPNINSAVNKTQYFINKLKEVSPDILKSITFKGEYKSVGKQILFSTKYGDIKMTPYTLLRGSLPSIESAVDKTDYFKNLLEERSPEIFKLLTFKSKYKNSEEYMLFSTKYGDISIKPHSLFRIKTIVVDSAVDKTQFFINRSIEIHGDKYDYSLVEYIHSKKKVKIICKKHGIFEQMPNSHLDGRGCIVCKYEDSKGAYTNRGLLEKYKEEFKNTPAKLYIFKLVKDKEIFFKIGITVQQILKRSAQMSPYSASILKSIKTNLFNAVLKEQELLEQFEEYKYTPEHKFGGYTECISINPLEKLKINLTEF